MRPSKILRKIIKGSGQWMHDGRFIKEARRHADSCSRKRRKINERRTKNLIVKFNREHEN
jgi:hypothetical protein